MALGGRREGAGRPKGSFNKPQIRNYFTAEELVAFMAKLKIDAETDPKIALWFADQLFGKARQNIGLDGGEDGTPIMFISSEIANKNGIDTSSEDNSLR